MKVTITQFRRDLFNLVEKAMSGVEVHVTHKGKSFTLTPDDPSIVSAVIRPWTSSSVIWRTAPTKRRCGSNGKRTGKIFDRLPGYKRRCLARCREVPETHQEAERVIRTAELLISPMVLLELEYLYDLGRSQLRSREVQRKLQSEVPLRICNLNLAVVADGAIDEGWTTDPFDRIIVANAKANGIAALITADEKIATHYPRTIW